jgi:hypothetical protein
MSKSKQQGTTHETSVKRRLQDAGIPADRLPEGGSLDPGDVWAISMPEPGFDDEVAVWWKRLSKLKDGQKNRRPDGEPEVVIITPEFFLALVAAWEDAVWEDRGIVIECKATQTLNVTRTLHKTRTKLSTWKQAQR